MTTQSTDEEGSGALATMLREVREHPLGYAVLVAFALAGPFVTAHLFPGAPTGLGFVGGLVFGMYAALCAVPGEFM
jgi:hypothetical protein